MQVDSGSKFVVDSFDRTIGLNGEGSLLLHEHRPVGCLEDRILLEFRSVLKGRPRSLEGGRAANVELKGGHSAVLDVAQAPEMWRSIGNVSKRRPAAVVGRFPMVVTYTCGLEEETRSVGSVYACSGVQQTEGRRRYL